MSPFEKSAEVAEEQTIIIRVGSVKFGTRREVVTIGNVTNIITNHRGEIIGRYLVDLQKFPYMEIREQQYVTLPFRKIGDRTWKLND